MKCDIRAALGMLKKKRDSRSAGGASSSSGISAADERLYQLFHELDSDCSGTLSVQELGRAVQTNAEFAKMMGVATTEGRPIPTIAAGLIAQNLRRLFDVFIFVMVMST